MFFLTAPGFFENIAIHTAPCSILKFISTLRNDLCAGDLPKSRRFNTSLARCWKEISYMLENDNMEAVDKGKFSHEKIKLQRKK